MRTLIIFLLLTTAAFGLEVTLEWDHPGDVDGFRVYSRTEGDYAFGKTPVYEGTELTCKIEVADDRQTALVATAFKKGNIDGTILESGPSNEVVVTPEAMEPDKPSLRIIDILIKALSDIKEVLRAS